MDQLGLALAFGVKGLGGVFNIRFRTSSRCSDSDLAMADEPIDLISPEHTRAVGALVLALSLIESRITDVLAATLNIHIIDAVAALHHQQLSNRIETLKALLDRKFRKADPKQAAKYKPIFDIIDSAKALAEYRNSIVHTSWRVNESGEPESVRFSARGEIRRSRTPRKPEQILERAREALGIAAQLENLASGLREPQRDRSV